MKEVIAANEHVRDSKTLLILINDLKVKCITAVADKLLFYNDVCMMILCFRYLADNDVPCIHVDRMQI